MRRLGIRCGLVAAAALLACQGADLSPRHEVGGTLVIATGQEADAMLPPLIETTAGRQVVDMLFMPIARLGDEMNILGDIGFSPALADRWEWSADSLSVAFHVDPRARWSDGTPVRPSDVRFSLRAFQSPGVSAAVAPNLDNVDSVSVRDASTFVVWYSRRSATQFFAVAHDLIPFPEHVYGAIAFDSLRASSASRIPVGSGKFRLAHWEPGVRVEIVADTAHWTGRPRLDRVVWLPISDPIGQAAKLVTGEADMVELLRGSALERAAATVRCDSTGAHRSTSPWRCSTCGTLPTGRGRTRFLATRPCAVRSRWPSTARRSCAMCSTRWGSRWRPHFCRRTEYLAPRSRLLIPSRRPGCSTR
jgi:peptide/nickel transport system substrate-binding protein